MKWKVAGLAGLLAMTLLAPVPTTEACGVKLTIKPSGPKKAVARSSNPSQVLLLGTHPRKLERELSAAGHQVEVAPTPAAAKRKSYAVVVVDDKQGGDARASFPSAVVVTRTGDVTSDIRSVEGQLSRKPVSVDRGRVAVAGETKRTPVAVGPEPTGERKLVATKDSGTPPPAPELKAEVKTEVKAEVKPPEVKPPEVKPDVKPPEKKPEKKIEAKPEKAPPEVAAVEPKPERVAAAPTAAFRSELRFGFSAYKLTRANQIALDQTARWLAANADVSVILEGHADTTGSPDANEVIADARAQAVRSYLVNAGVDSSRLEVVSHGDKKPKYPGADGRNRRVMLIKK